MKKRLFQVPEYYLVIFFLLAGYTPPFHFNPLFILPLALIVLQLFFKHKATGIILATLFCLGNLYFLGALLSEFHEFTEFNSSAKELLFVGLAIWLVNLVMSVIMILKYTLDKKVQPQGRIK